MTSDNTDSTLALVCAACRAGPFSYEGFRQAVAEWHYDDSTGYSYTRTWRAISESISKENCHWCEIVRRSRDGLPASRFPVSGEENVEIKFQVGTRIRKALGIFLNGKKAAEYWIYASPDDPATSELNPKPNTFKKQSYVDYERALQCVKACNDHEHCPAVEETNLPSRVIDCTDPSKPRLFETHRQIKAHYCALSYVWGGEQHQKTTTSNIDAYVREGFNVPLPQTIADAIFVTNKLGCRYLWVDALCIIQDSDEDKIKELVDMAHIYRDAYITISVLSSFRADHGFLPDERPPDVVPFYTSGSRSPGHMLMEYIIPRPTPGLGKYETVTMHRPLDERGWCLQESILPSRRLIFQPPFVSYKCPSFSELEITRLSPRDRLFSGQASAYPANDYILFPTNQNTDLESDEKALRERWRRILLDYTKRRITVPSDKFVALAGIAEIFGTISKDRYIAGLWQRTLLYDLLWAVWPPMGPDEVPLPRPPGYRAPSWSWASVDAKLDLNTFQPPPSAASYEAEILECNASPKRSVVPFGELTDAKLALNVKIHPLMRDGTKCSFTEIRGTHEGNQFVSTSLNWRWLPPVGNCLEPIPSSMDGGERLAGIIFDSVEGTTPDPQDFYVVILRAGRQWRNQGDWMHGLLVLLVDGEVDHYRRVAKLNLQYDFQWPDWFDMAPLKTITLV